MKLTDYRTLGRSGLVVSPLTLGTMTFGKEGWGADADASKAIFHAYLEAGGNSIDTADIYAAGRSEELLGGYIADSKTRDKVVLATKFTFNQDDSNPNSGGNGRKNVYRALENSLRRLQTDYIDLYWLHFWDGVTPGEEVLQTLGDLQRAGKIRYFGLSDVPAWYAARAASLAQAHAVPGPVALQMEYSLVAREIEHEHLPLARECGLGLMPWSPLAGGFLAGKYARPESGSNAKASGEGRLSGSNPLGDSKFTARNWDTLDALKSVAAEVGRPPAQVALAWAAGRSGITSTILGASRVEQIKDNLASLEITLTPEQTQALNKASAVPSAYDYFAPETAFGMPVQGWK